jgi:hypothetical protein
MLHQLYWIRRPVTGHGLDGPGIGSRWGAKFSTSVQAGLVLSTFMTFYRSNFTLTLTPTFCMSNNRINGKDGLRFTTPSQWLLAQTFSKKAGQPASLTRHEGDNFWRRSRNATHHHHYHHVHTELGVFTVPWSSRWPLGNAPETAADLRGCRRKSSLLKLDPFS